MEIASSWFGSVLRRKLGPYSFENPHRTTCRVWATRKALFLFQVQVLRIQRGGEAIPPDFRLALPK